MACHGSDGRIATAISAVVPFYNLEGYVGQCLDSVVAAFRAQGPGVRSSLEVICVDDGSTDSTGRLLDEYADSLARSGPDGLSMRVVHKVNGGEGAARNTGVAESKGRWVTFLDGDDVWLANHLQVAVPLLEDNSSADIVALKYASFEDGAPPPEPTSAEAKTFDLSSSIPSEVLLEVGVFPTFVKRRFVAADLFSALPLGADRLYMAQCFAHARKIVKCDAVVHGYRVRDGSMARKDWNERKVTSLCYYAFCSLEVLSSSRKSIGREGHEYLASTWLSDVPNRIARLPRPSRLASWRCWRMTLDLDCLRALPRFDCIRRLLRICTFSMDFSLAVARLLRKVGVS